MREVMGIRARPLPSPVPLSPDQARAEQTKALLELQQFYAIKVSDEEAQEGFQAGLDKFAATLISRAKRGV